MHGIRKCFRFIIFLAKNARFRTAKIDFEKKRINLVGQFFPEVTPRPSKSHSGLRQQLMQFGFFYYLISNIADLKNRNQAITQFFVVDSLGLIYQRMFKNASISILGQLLPKIHSHLDLNDITDNQIDAMSHYCIQRDISKMPENYTCFAVVRNPFARLVSAYLDLFGKADEFSYDTYLFGVFRQEMTFKELIKALYQIPDIFRGPHFVSQAFSIANTMKYRDVRVFKLDESQSELSEFLSKYNLRLTHKNKSVDNYNYVNFYDSESLELVRTMYEDDILQFGYQHSYSTIQKSIKSNSPSSGSSND